MQKLSRKNTLFVSLTLFSLFFGAGNLIFPPFLGESSGSHTMLSLAGFYITAVCFPIFAVIRHIKASRPLSSCIKSSP
ncbi:branched-chain amino acid transport system II carrier protein [Erysipelothrix piscisicarius]